MIPVLLAVGLAWILLRKSDDDSTSDDDVPNDDVPTHDPTYQGPTQPTEEGTKEAVYTSIDGQTVVWKIGVPVYQKIYENYETSQVFTWDIVFEYHYQIGNVEGTSFEREAVSGGGPNTPAVEPIITIYRTKQAAIDKILRDEERDAEEECEEGYTYDRILKRCVRDAPPPPDNSRPPSPGLGGGYTDISSSMGV